MIDNIKNALASIWSNKVRSLLTVLGVVIGVSSVTTLISLGQGLQNDVSGLIRGLGSNVITVVSGKIDTSNGGAGTSNNPASFISGDILTVKDTEDISNMSGIKTASPLSPAVGNLKKDDRQSNSAVFGAYHEISEAFEVLKVDKGNMFDKNNAGNVIVLGPQPAIDLFGEEDPVGKKVEFAKKEFEVIGVFGKPKSTSVFGSEMETLSIIPFDTATELNKNQIKILRIVVKADDDADVKKVKEDMNSLLKNNHGGEEDFTVLTQDDILDLFGQFLTLATTMVSAIAAISLVVGGIGIMNIMLVTVTERTREIGLRKAVGATKTAIAFQFLVEAVVITMVGGLIGLGIAFGVGAIVASQTPLTPAITPEVILTALGISTFIGLVFGLWPALRAAKKDPIEALRYE